MWKLMGTMRICGTLFMARTFGRYEHSVWMASATTPDTCGGARFGRFRLNQ